MANLKEPRGYEEDFDSDWYLTEFYGRVEGSQTEKLIKFYLDFFLATFATGHVGGDKLLDIGTGPTVYSVISASPHVTEIHLSEFTDRNRQVLQKWRGGAENVPACFEYFMKRENKNENVESRNKMMREKVKKIYPLDLQQDKPFVDFDCKYDVITSSLCMEAVARNMQEYRLLVSKVAGMLNPGGSLVMVGVLGEEFYVVGNFKFPCQSLKGDDVQSSLKEAGFAIKDWKVFSDKSVIQEETKNIADLQGLFAVLAHKTNTLS